MTLAEPYAYKAHRCSVGESNHFADTRHKKNGGGAGLERDNGDQSRSVLLPRDGDRALTD